jgi:hypothetical protein
VQWTLGGWNRSLFGADFGRAVHRRRAMQRASLACAAQNLGAI